MTAATITRTPWDDYRAVIEDAAANAPRALQSALGPSQIGCGCDRCLIHLLAGHRTAQDGIPWLPWIGTAVHEQLELAFIRHIAATGTDRYLLEQEVAVGTLRGVPITGHADLIDTHAGVVNDWKVVGASTLRKAKASGPSSTYRRQAHLYARGANAAGWTVEHVQITYLPRNAASLRDAVAWTEPYDEAVAVEALDRANALAFGVDSMGVDQMLRMCPPCTGEEFSCGRWPGDAKPATPQTPDAFLGLVG